MRSSAPRCLSSPITPVFRTLRIACCSSPMVKFPRRARTRPAAPPPSLAGNPLRALDIKLFRDLRRLWAQVLAIALVIAGGGGFLLLVGGRLRALGDTRAV